MSAHNRSMNTDQSGSQVGGDQVGGNKTVVVEIHNPAPIELGGYNALEKLSSKLTEECLGGETADGTIESLSYYKRQRAAKDGIVGLKAKLDKVDRSDDFEDALDQKVLFASLLEEWSYYASAQEIFAHLLSRIKRKHQTTIFPYIKELPKHVIDDMVDKSIIEPVISDCGAVQEFHVNYDIALGMYYWLADQCFIRWHE